MSTERMKIFGIGLSKTGTSSLAGALELLGYRTKDYPGAQTYVPSDLATLEPGLLDAYDAFTDTPIPSLYKALDARYPGSKFILTIRDMDGWLKSCKKQFTEKHAANLNAAHHQLFMELYGCTTFDEARFREGYERFTRDVLEHFGDRPDDLLVLNVTAGEGWEKLCPFLDRPEPGVPFPKANVTQIRWMKIQDVIAIAQEAAALLPVGGTSPAAARPGLVRWMGALLARWRGMVVGGHAGVRRELRSSMEKLVTHRLQMLNAEIPVLSPSSANMPYDQRKQLNHLWQVDPLRCPEGTSGWEGCSVSIALIEDRKPIYGVVFEPASGTIYHAALGKGAHKSAGGGPSVRLEVQPQREPAARALSGRPALLLSPALRICKFADGSEQDSLVLENAEEWQVAAADAILRSMGQSLQDCQGGRPLAYNSQDLRHPCVLAGQAQRR
jgi:3'-phosphoadenosine 5'-phosphosulfate (PAPS) 3'-phosphatase